MNETHGEDSIFAVHHAKDAGRYDWEKEGELMKVICSNYGEIHCENNKVHLCDSCKELYPECPADGEDMLWGDGKGNDNICCCAYYVPLTTRKECRLGVMEADT